jgi:hypothetical protein
MRPTRSVPGGCVVALFGLGALLYAAFAFTAAWMINQKNIPSERLEFLVTSGVVATAAGLILVLFGYKLAVKIDRNYDPDDPDEPRAKF